ncbi:hypothetical protein J6590_003834 [Homalodisca vitripennis]|nr:hypothetical protein J6590_003834 [Homalodisca vitripennis]
MGLIREVEDWGLIVEVVTGAFTAGVEERWTAIRTGAARGTRGGAGRTAAVVRRRGGPRWHLETWTVRYIELNRLLPNQQKLEMALLNFHSRDLWSGGSRVESSYDGHYQSTTVVVANTNRRCPSLMWVDSEARPQQQRCQVYYEGHY